MSKSTTYKFSYPTERGRKDVVDCYMAESREKTVRESGGEIERMPPNKSRKKQETLGLPAKNRAFTTGT
jgi:hypothetical protein